MTYQQVETTPVVQEAPAPENTNVVKKQGKHRCNLCEKTFMILASRRWHMLAVHTTIKYWFMCDLCDKTHRYYANLLKHKKDSHFQNFAVMPADGYSSFRCALCQERFTSQCSFLRHIEGKHPSEGNAVVCDQKPVARKQVVKTIQQPTTVSLPTQVTLPTQVSLPTQVQVQPIAMKKEPAATMVVQTQPGQPGQAVATTTNETAYLGQHVSLVYNPNPYYNINVNDNRYNF